MPLTLVRGEEGKKKRKKERKRGGIRYPLFPGRLGIALHPGHATKEKRKKKKRRKKMLRLPA